MFRYKDIFGGTTEQPKSNSTDSQVSKNDVESTSIDRKIPSIELRKATFDDSVMPDLQSSPSLSPSPSSMASTAHQSPPSVSSDGLEEIELSDEQRQQMVENVFTHLDSMVGMEKVKLHFREIASRIEHWRKLKVDLGRKRFHMMFLGNPGTGKTTVGRLYAQLLLGLSVLPRYRFVETSGATLTSRGIDAAMHIIDSGVVFIDEAYQLTLPHQPGGRQVLDHIHILMENNRSNLIFIFAGYKKDMEAFVEHNSGMNERIPDKIHFDDFTAKELLTILKQKLTEDYGERMKIEAHPDDQEGQSRYLTIVAERLSRGRNNRGFGNARAVENQLQRITKRQVERLNSQPEDLRDCFALSREDLIGPHPSITKFQSKAWSELQGLIGLDALKVQCSTIIGLSETNYERELQGLDPELLSLNGLFMGSPGTGKTTVAKLYGRILADLGLLSNGEVVMKNASDFIGETLGSSEARTRAVLASTIGKVLIIDEAYGLGAANSGSGNNGSNNNQDSFRAGVIDTLVSEVHGAPGEDRCVLLLGYEDKLREMFQRSNPGLASRFNYSAPFRFDDFTPDQLMEILRLKMKQQDLTATGDALETARAVLERASLTPGYGNARAAEICLQAAKQRHQERLQTTPVADRNYAGELQPGDFDPDHAVKAGGFADCEQLLAGHVSRSVIKQISRVQKQALMARFTQAKDFRGLVPTRFVFRGPPGTGKTTAARLMGKVFYDLGYLATDETIEYSVRDFIAAFVGQTRSKTREQLATARGKVLIIDNAFQLLKGPYELEALQELIACLESDEYAGKIVVILVGYNEEMGMLLHTCPPLAALFAHEVTFTKLRTKACLRLLHKELEKVHVSASFLMDESCDDYHIVEKHFNILQKGPVFANAKDVESLAQSMKTALFDEFYRRNRSSFGPQGLRDPPTLPELSRAQASSCIERLTRQRRCMKPPALIPNTEINYSDDDSQFARAFEYAYMPRIEIHIHTATQRMERSGASRVDDNMFDDSSHGTSRAMPRLGALSITLSIGADFSRMPNTMPGSDALQYYKPPEIETAHGYVEEIDDDDDDDDSEGGDEPNGDKGQASAAAVATEPQVKEATAPEKAKAKAKAKIMTTSAPFAVIEEHPLDHQKAKAKELDEFKLMSPINRYESQRYRTMLRHRYPEESFTGESTRAALKQITGPDYCSFGYPWRRDVGRHVCEGGCHYTYDFQLRDHMYMNDM